MPISDVTPENTTKDQKTTSTSISILLKIFSELPETAKPLIPFMLIKYIASNNWHEFIKATTTLTNTMDVSENDLTSSCFNTAYANALIFFGSSLAGKLYKRLETEIELCESEKLKSGKTWDYSLKGVFDGDIICDINKNESPTIHQNNSKISTYIKTHANAFFNYIRPTLDECLKNSTSDDEAILKLKKYFTTIEYNFNTHTISEIEKEIEVNKNKTDFNRSHVYYIAITRPEQNETIFEHVFLIEQFFCANQNDVRYRIYQSWIGQSTLLDDLNKRGYRATGENALNNDEIFKFFKNFKERYCKNKNLKYRLSAKQCFGYFTEEKPLLMFDNKSNTLSGLGVRYASAEIDPKQCIQNFIDFVTTHPELEATFRGASNIPQLK